MARSALLPDEIQSFRDDLCRVASRRFAELGYAGVTLRGLAAELGCSYGTVHRLQLKAERRLQELLRDRYGLTGEEYDDR